MYTQQKFREVHLNGKLGFMNWLINQNLWQTGAVHGLWKAGSSPFPNQLATDRKNSPRVCKVHTQKWILEAFKFFWFMPISPENHWTVEGGLDLNSPRAAITWQLLDCSSTSVKKAVWDGAGVREQTESGLEAAILTRPGNGHPDKDDCFYRRNALIETAGGPRLVQREGLGFSWCFFSPNLPTFGVVWACQADASV